MAHAYIGYWGRRLHRVHSHPTLLERGHTVTVLDTFARGRPSWPPAPATRPSIRSAAMRAMSACSTSWPRAPMSSFPGRPGRRAAVQGRPGFGHHAEPRRRAGRRRPHLEEPDAGLSDHQFGLRRRPEGPVLHRGNAPQPDLAVRRDEDGRRECRPREGRRVLPPGNRLRHLAAHAHRSARQRLHLARRHRPARWSSSRGTSSATTSTCATW